MDNIIIPSDLSDFIISLLISSLGFVLYLGINRSSLSEKNYLYTENNVRQVLFQRLSGVFFFGIIPLLFILGYSNYSLSDFGAIKPVPMTFLWTIILGLVILILTHFDASSEMNLQLYPQIRSENWSIKIVMISVLSWGAYLLAFEFLFRGYFFFSSLRVIGLWPAILLNCGIYALVHNQKGNKEMLGSIPLGIILCYITYITGSIWGSFFVHLIISLSNEYFSIRAHPNMKFVKSWK